MYFCAPPATVGSMVTITSGMPIGNYNQMNGAYMSNPGFVQAKHYQSHAPYSSGLSYTSNPMPNAHYPMMQQEQMVAPQRVPRHDVCQDAHLGKHVQMGADGVLRMTVVDPQTRKLQIPYEYVFPTRASQRGTLPSLCQLFLKGRCRQGNLCYQVHADHEIIASLRAQIDSLPRCCAFHGDKDHASALDPLMRDVISVYVPGCSWNGTGVVPLCRFSFTTALRKLLIERRSEICATRNQLQSVKMSGDEGASHNPRIILSADDIPVCRLHLMDRCRYAEECKFLHVCQNVMEQDPHFSKKEEVVVATGLANDHASNAWMSPGEMQQEVSAPSNAAAPASEHAVISTASSVSAFPDCFAGPRSLDSTEMHNYGMRTYANSMPTGACASSSSPTPLKAPLPLLRPVPMNAIPSGTRRNGTFNNSTGSFVQFEQTDSQYGAAEGGQDTKYQANSMVGLSSHIDGGVSWSGATLSHYDSGAAAPSNSNGSSTELDADDENAVMSSAAKVKVQRRRRPVEVCQTNSLDMDSYYHQAASSLNAVSKMNKSWRHNPYCTSRNSPNGSQSSDNAHSAPM